MLFHRNAKLGLAGRVRLESEYLETVATQHV
jgi:hypothetical protein